MAKLIRVTRVVNETASRSPESPEILINTMKIRMVEHNLNDSIEGATRILLDNGKSIYVEESQDDIMERANSESGEGSSLLGGIVDTPKRGLG